MTATINKGTEDDATGVSAHTQSTTKDSFHKNELTIKDNSSDNSSTSKNDKFKEHDVSPDDDDNEGHHDGVHMRSGQGWGRGIVQDVKRTLGTHWKKEMTNLNSKVRVL